MPQSQRDLRRRHSHFLRQCDLKQCQLPCRLLFRLEAKFRTLGAHATTDPYVSLAVSPAMSRASAIVACHLLTLQATTSSTYFAADSSTLRSDSAHRATHGRQWHRTWCSPSATERRLRRVRRRICESHFKEGRSQLLCHRERVLGHYLGSRQISSIPIWSPF